MINKTVFFVVISAFLIGSGVAYWWQQQGTEFVFLDPEWHNEAQFIGWGDLLPEQDYASLQEAEKKRQAILGEQSLSEQERQLLASVALANDEDYQNALQSQTVRSELHQQNVEIAGFVVPLEFDQQRRVTQFFIVPYYGACIHYPPPPPNQIIYARSNTGFKVEDISKPFLFAGQLHTALYEDPVATSAYLLELGAVSFYNTEPDEIRQH